jgi:hypothetical protein
MIGWLLFGLGAFVCLVNFYLSWLRYPLHRARGRARETYRWVSGFPLVGSLLVVVAWVFWLCREESLALDVTAWVLALIDTGGIHWFLVVMAADRFHRRGRPSV